MKKGITYFFAAAVLCCAASSCFQSGEKAKEQQGQQQEEEPVSIYGFRLSEYSADTLTVRSGDTFTGLMEQKGASGLDAFKLSQMAKGIFDVTDIRPDKVMEFFYRSDSLRPDWVVYHNDKIRKTLFCLKDTLYVKNIERQVELRELKADVTIKTSLWVDMTEAGCHPALIAELSDILAWTVDFFSLQEGDRFRVLYTERWCGKDFIDISRIDFAIFSREGSPDEYAIRLSQGDGGNEWWNEKGESLRKAFLKAPLQFRRISSGFTMRRKHPITGRVQPHTGVDYAAPKGTPVVALGDGTVIFAAYKGAGGNTVKIRHNSVYTTGYLHLSRYGKGIRSGARVHQGQVIGYVGSTGRSTGPHLDFRVWKNGSPVNPLKLKSPSAQPIKPQNKPLLDSVLRRQLEIMETRPSANLSAESEGNAI